MGFIIKTNTFLKTVHAEFSNLRMMDTRELNLKFFSVLVLIIKAKTLESRSLIL